MTPIGSVTPLARTLDHELLALSRGASLECPVCGEFVLHEGAVVRCVECGMKLYGRVGQIGGTVSATA